ncbi:MAG: GNAT family N-acetyltransferase [Bryobacteraceae bacterium]|nr:GNAT family N-acetyltransferase [Bryobacteraceae bacterium]
MRTAATTNPTLRPATAADADAIAGYNSAMALETEGLALDRDRLTRGVQTVLEDASKGFYIVAEAGGRIVGQMMITYEWSDWRNGTFWWIQSVYVHPDFRRHGVFSALYRHVAALAVKEPGVCGLRLYVEGENHNAQRSYERLGMKRTSYTLYQQDFVLGP